MVLQEKRTVNRARMKLFVYAAQAYTAEARGAPCLYKTKGTSAGVHLHPLQRRFSPMCSMIGLRRKALGINDTQGFFVFIRLNLSLVPVPPGSSWNGDYFSIARVGLSLEGVSKPDYR